MSIATIRNDGPYRRQSATHIARNLSVVESIGWPPAEFGVQSVGSDLHQTDEDAALHDHNDERLLNARQVADRCSTTKSRSRFIRRTGTVSTVAFGTRKPVACAIASSRRRFGTLG